MTEATGERAQAMEEGPGTVTTFSEGSAGPVEDRRRRRGSRIDAADGVPGGVVAACPEMEHIKNISSSGQTGRGGLAGADGIPFSTKPDAPQAELPSWAQRFS